MNEPNGGTNTKNLVVDVLNQAEQLEPDELEQNMIVNIESNPTHDASMEFDEQESTSQKNDDITESTQVNGPNGDINQNETTKDTFTWSPFY